VIMQSSFLDYDLDVGDIEGVLDWTDLQTLLS